MATTDRMSAEDVERELERLSEQEYFDPPEDFRKHALITDESVYDEAEKDWKGWWLEQAKELRWSKEPTESLDDSNPPFYKWFTDGKINACYNCVDRHVEDGNGDKVAYHWRGEEGEERDITYADLHRDVQRFANALKDFGVEPGDVVAVYLPMIPEVAVAMLACARIGAVHNVIFGGFSPDSVKERVEVSTATVLITADGTRRKGKTAEMKAKIDEAVAELDSLQTIIVVKDTDAACEMKEGRDHWYHEVLDKADDECPCEELDAEHPLFILYSSGSTAKPKGILHTTGGYLAGAMWTTKYCFDLKDEDIFWCAADVGWVTGHTYIVYGPLTNGTTGVMFEGAPDYPDKDIHWQLVEKLGVTIYYFAPTAIRAFMKWGPEHPQKHDLSSLRLLGTVGEPINPKAWLWYHLVIGGERCPIVDTWWQTETGHALISPLPGVTRNKPGSASRPLPAIAAEVLDESSSEPVTDGQGLLVLNRPWPGMLRTLYQDDDRYEETYWERFGPETYLVGDAARKDEDDYFWIIGRIDDVVNVSGHRMSTAEVESAIVAHAKVAEAAVIGMSDEDSGQAICAYVTLEGDAEGGDEIEGEIKEIVSKRIGKLARPKRTIWTPELPKTRSGKIMRRLLRDIAEGRELGDVSTLADPSVVEDLQKQAEGDGKEDGKS